MELIQRNGWSQVTRSKLRRDTPATLAREPKLAGAPTRAIVLLAAGCIAAYSASPGRRAITYAPAFGHVQHGDLYAQGDRNDVDIHILVNALGLSMKGLAELMGVSRQAVYDWRKDGAISSENLAKLRDLRDAAIQLRQAHRGTLPIDWMTRTLDESGVTFKSGFTTGHSATELASMLIGVWRTGERKRNELDALLGGIPLQAEKGGDAPYLGETYRSR